MGTRKKGDARNLPILILTIFLFLTIFAISASANVNLTVLSKNNKSITVTDIDTGVVLGTVNQSESISVPYHNIHLKVNTENTLTLPVLKTAMLSASQRDIIMMIILALLLAFAFALVKM